MRTSSIWRSAWFCSVSAALCIGLTGCATQVQQARHTDARAQLAAEPPLCQQLRSAWVGNFKANVAAMSADQAPEEAPRLQLADVRNELRQAGLDEAQCTKPYCIIQPLSGGKLDSYCGYRIAATQGDTIYQWEPWTGQ